MCIVLVCCLVFAIFWHIQVVLRSDVYKWDTVFKKLLFVLAKDVYVCDNVTYMKSFNHVPTITCTATTTTTTTTTTTYYL